MSGETGHLREGGIAPQDNVVLRVSVSADYLIGAARPGQVAHLRGEREREREQIKLDRCQM